MKRRKFSQLAVLGIPVAIKGAGTSRDHGEEVAGYNHPSHGCGRRSANEEFWSAVVFKGTTADRPFTFTRTSSPRCVQKLDLLQIVQVAEPVATVLAAILAQCAGALTRFDCC